MLMWAYCNKVRALTGLGKYLEASEEIEKAIKLNGPESKLTYIKEKLRFILDLEGQRLKGLNVKKKTLINDAEEAFGDKEYWFSLWASREIQKTDKEHIQANLLELESMTASFMFRPALAKAEQIKHL